LDASRGRLIHFLRAAGLATGCEVVIDHNGSMAEIRQNAALGESHRPGCAVVRFNCPLGGDVANIVLNKYGAIDYEYGISSASTDFVGLLSTN